MALLIDKPLWQFRGEKWSHLVSDESYDELHGFAKKLGIPCLLYTSPSPRDLSTSRMPSSA